MSLGCACSAGRRWPSYDSLASVRLTVVVENRDGSGCTGAHGLAIWVESPGAVVLVDTGPDAGLLAANAARLGLDLARVDAVVLSHGHDDHSGGLPAVVEAKRGRTLTVALHPDATRPRYSRRTGTPRSIGMPPSSLQALTRPGVERLPTSLPACIVPGIWATGTIPRVHLGAQERYLVLDPEGRHVDPLNDDQAVVIDTIQGLVVVCGCAHAGLANTLGMLAGIRPGSPIAALIGGLHLGSAGSDRILVIAENLLAQGIRTCACGHCTGTEAEGILGDRLGSRFTALACGTTLAIG